MSNVYVTKGFFPNEYFDQTAKYIASLQLPDGAIPWFEGGYTDPWDHVESAMGLSITGYHDQATKAYHWLRTEQLANGGWWAAYQDGSVDPTATRVETNFVAYVATGVWHHYLISEDISFLQEMWATIEAAIGFILEMQADTGEVYWAWDKVKGVDKDALITGCSSIYKSLECAHNIAITLGHNRSHWLDARLRLGQCVRSKPECFDRTWESKERYSMDWFYPVLTGVIRDARAKAHLQQKWDTFVVDNLGCRCVSDQPWVTMAESSELTMALIAAGETQKAAMLFSWLHEYRDNEGAYWTGYVYPDDTLWPEEKPSWTAGAILLAADALALKTPAAKLFTSVNLLAPAQDCQGVHYGQVLE